MIGLPEGVRVYLAAGRTDLRRGIDGLAAQIQTVLRENPFCGLPETFPVTDRWQGMADDPDTMRARLDRLTELVELARQVPWEDHGHVERALHLISQALQKVAQVRSQNQDEARLGEEAEFVTLCRQIEEMCRLAGLRIQNDRTRR